MKHKDLIEHLTARAEAAEADARRFQQLLDRAEIVKCMSCEILYLPAPTIRAVGRDFDYRYNYRAAIDAELAKEPKP